MKIGLQQRFLQTQSLVSTGGLVGNANPELLNQELLGKDTEASVGKDSPDWSDVKQHLRNPEQMSLQTSLGDH